MKLSVFIFSLILSGLFGRAELIEFRYWFNQDSNNAKIISFSANKGSISIPYQSGKGAKVNMLNLQVKKSDGVWSVPYRCLFQPPCSENFNLLYSLDGGEISTLTDNCVDGSKTGLHNLYIIDRDMNILPKSALIYNITSSKQNLRLSLTSLRNSISQSVPIQNEDSLCYIDVHNITPGIYPVNITISDTVSRAMVAMLNTNVEISAPLGNRLTDIYYWLNDSIGNSRKYEMKNAVIPYKGSVELPVADFGVPSLDYHLSLDGEQPYIAPNYEIKLSMRNNYGFAADSVATITENSKRVELTANNLKPSIQFDTDSWRTDSCYWYEFPAVAGDDVALSTRLRCKVKLYSPEAVLIDTAIFNFKKLELRKKLEESGTYYVQLSEIEQSRREFSVLLTYLSGPTADKDIVPEPTYVGIPVEWQKSSDWKQDESGISYTTKGITMAVNSNNAVQQPYVADNSRICRIYADNHLEFSAGNYIEQVTLCLPKIPNYVFPKIVTTQGEIKIDSLTNTMVWNGFARKAELTVKSQDDNTLLPIVKAYVKLSDLTANDIELSDGTDYRYNFDEPYNLVRLWRIGEEEEEASYPLREDTKITFENNEMLVVSNGKTYRHSTSDKLILTYDYDKFVSVDEQTVAENNAKVTISGDNIRISGLPAMVGIYSVSGITYYQRYISSTGVFLYPIANLQSGVYIIRVGNQSTKILIP